MSDLLFKVGIDGVAVAAVFAVAYLGRKLRLNYSRDWPVVQGVVESIYAEGGGQAGAQFYLAYSYSIDGQYFAGKEASPFGKPLTEAAADEWKGKRVLVRYNP